VAGSFGRSLTVGIEEELMLLDPETFGLAPGVEHLLGPEGLKTELFSCLVETNTPVCESVDQALGELRRLRGLVAAGRAAVADERLLRRLDVALTADRDPRYGTGF